MKNDIKQFLNEGHLTKIDSIVQGVVDGIKGDKFEYLIGILDYLDKNLPFDRTKGFIELFNKRTASQIITDKFSTGCTDTALVFVTLSRAKGVPTKYVETLSKRWLEDPQASMIRGHAFAEVYLNNRWYVVDPDMKNIRVNNSVYDFFEIYAVGLDPYEMGLTSFDDMKKIFLKYKEDWNKSKK
ncbi:transglutaminase domain-containing protein [Patescibacteria group bacterium]|nr:transglutaminase domain-containing protein [Patescibacteria group bacterium]